MRPVGGFEPKVLKLAGTMPPPLLEATPLTARGMEESGCPDVHAASIRARLEAMRAIELDFIDTSLRTVRRERAFARAGHGANRRGRTVRYVTATLPLIAFE